MAEEEIIEKEEKKEFKVPQKPSNAGRNLLLLFFVTFVIVVIVATMFFKSIFANVDVNIGENPVASMNQRSDEEDDDLNIRAQIDQRLKMIQNEEEMPGVSERGYETDEEIVERLRRDETKNRENRDKKEENQIENTEKQNDSENHKFVMDTVLIPPEAPKTTSNIISKIYIGQYSDMQRAVEMQANILNSGINVTPIIKEVNGYYTIQAGAFANYDSAKALVEQLNNEGFSAKIVRELK